MGGKLSRGGETPALFLWGLYFVSAPFYLFPSGLPQVSDFILALCVGVALLRPRLPWPREVRSPVITLLLLVAYVVLVNLSWAIKTSSSEMAFFSLFYAYNGVAFLLVIRLHGRNRARFLRVTAHAVLLSLLVQCVLSPLCIDFTRARQVLFFNNPNQLGYYAVLAVSLFSLASGATGDKGRGLRNALAFAASTYLAMLSLSKAAIAAIAFLLLTQFLRRPLVLLSVAVLFVGAIVYLDSSFPIASNLVQRISGIGQETDNTLAQRGYDRIIHHPRYLVLGAGEGDTHRFESALPGEIHSTFATLLFSYGLPGLLLFLLLQLFLAAESFRAFLGLLPAFLYGLTHNGLRNTFLWVCFALVLVWAIERRQPSCAGTADALAARER